MFTVCGGCVSWKSNLQKVVALSSTEAKYMVATEVVKEALWLKGLTRSWALTLMTSQFIVTIKVLCIS